MHNADKLNRSTNLDTACQQGSAFVSNRTSTERHDSQSVTGLQSTKIRRHCMKREGVEEKRAHHQQVLQQSGTYNADFVEAQIDGR